MTGSNIGHIILAFIGIVLVLFLAYYLTRFYAKKMGTMFGTSQNIRVVDKIPVGKGSSIAVVELQEKQYLLGITEHSINLIDTLDEKIEKTPMMELPSISDSGFMKTLKSVIGKESGDDKIDTDK